MAINKKNKNRAYIDGKEYIWWVFDEYDQSTFDGIQVKAVCSDQSHMIYYGLEQSEVNRKVAIALKNYTKLVHLGNPPRFESEAGILTRSGVVRMIQWCRRDGHNILYAVDGWRNDLTEEQKTEIFNEILEVVDRNETQD